MDAKEALSEITGLLSAAAIKSCDAHRRYSELVKAGAPVAEQKTALKGLRTVDEILDEAVDLYEVACLQDPNHGDDPWWHRANMVWRTAKEYLRHQVASNRLTRGGSDHGHAELRELNIEYELEASASVHLPQRHRGTEVGYISFLDNGIPTIFAGFVFWGNCNCGKARVEASAVSLRNRSSRCLCAPVACAGMP